LLKACVDGSAWPPLYCCPFCVGMFETGAGRVRGHALKQSAPCHQQHVRQQAMVMMMTPMATPATKPTFAMLMDWKGRPEQPEPEHAEMAWQLPSVLWRGGA
jgi:hypothetical protein